MLLTSQVAYHDYEGVALDLMEQRLVADIGDKKLMVLRNHGTLAVGENCALAFIAISLLERACTAQIRAMAELNRPSQAALDTTAEQSKTLFGPGVDALVVKPCCVSSTVRPVISRLGMISAFSNCWPCKLVVTSVAA